MGIIDRLRGTEGPGPRPVPAARTVLAAAMPLNGPGVKAVSRARRQSTTDAWQNDAWYYYDVNGELRAALTWIANAVSQADLHATTVDPDTGKPTGPSDDQRAQTIASMAFGGFAQRAGLLKTLAICWQCVGEAWIVIRPGKVGKPDKWLVLAGDKVRAKGEEWQYTDPMSGVVVTLTAQDRLLRVWSPHAHDQAKADSAVRASIPVLREIEKATQNIAARLDSRIAMNGLMAVAEELNFPKGDFDTGSEAFMDRLLANAEYGLQNPGQASAQVPMAFEAPGELIANGGAFAHYDISTEFDAQVVTLRQDGRQMLAGSLDMPKQVAEGSQGEGNHWSDWKVEEDTYKIYIEPLLKAIGNAVDEHWFRPALIADGMSPEAAEFEEIGWDTTAIVARPDATETLESLYDKILISDEYFLAEHGVPEDAMPDQEERTRRFLEKAVLGAPTLMSDPNVTQALDLGIEIAPVAAGVDANVTSGGELEAPEPAPAPVRALPNQADQATEPEPVPAGLAAAAEVLVRQALSRAGGRLLTNQNRGQFKGVERHELYMHIRPEDLTGLVNVQFATPVAEAFGMSRGRLAGGLCMYVEHLLKTGEAFDRDRMTWYLR